MPDLIHVAQFQDLLLSVSSVICFFLQFLSFPSLFVSLHWTLREPLVEEAVFADRSRAKPQATFARGSPSSRPDSTPARPTRARVCVGVIQNSPGSIDIPCSSRALLVGCWPDFYLTGERREQRQTAATLATETADHQFVNTWKKSKSPTRKRDFRARLSSSDLSVMG